MIINKEMKVNEILEKYPQTVDIFVQNGIKNINDEKVRKMLGNLSLKNLLLTKKINADIFVDVLNTFLEESNKSIELGEQKLDNKDISVMGLLPCPIRIPLLEQFNEFLTTHPSIKVEYELKAASSGLDWLKEDVIKADNVGELSDVFISAGFDLFFEKNLMGKFKTQKIFKDITGITKYNSDFENDEINLKDPKGDYSMLGVVPAIFLVNRDMLGDRKMPTSWKDLLTPEFENSVSLPISDFDLFNSILVHIGQKYGDEGVSALGRTLLENLHPSQMVKSDKFKQNVPTITIMPYFFSKMLNPQSSMVAVWPNDGAIISPIFMLTKAEKENELKPVAEFLSSKKVGEIMSHEGLFPSVNPEVDNYLDGKKFMWCGWDYIYNNDIGEVLEKNKKLFFNASEVK